MLPLHQRHIVEERPQRCDDTQNLPHRRASDPLQAAEVGIEPTNSWFKARHHYQQRLLRILREGRAGLEPAREYLTGTCSATELPTQNIASKSALRESNPPCQGGNLVPLPLGQEHLFVSGKRGSRTHQDAVRVQPPSKRPPSPIGLPFHSSTSTILADFTAKRACAGVLLSHVPPTKQVELPSTHAHGAYCSYFPPTGFAPFPQRTSAAKHLRALPWASTSHRHELSVTPWPLEPYRFVSPHLRVASFRAFIA